MPSADAEVKCTHNLHTIPGKIISSRVVPLRTAKYSCVVGSVQLSNTTVIVSPQKGTGRSGFQHYHSTELMAS